MGELRVTYTETVRNAIVLYMIQYGFLLLFLLICAALSLLALSALFFSYLDEVATLLKIDGYDLLEFTIIRDVLAVILLFVCLVVLVLFILNILSLYRSVDAVADKSIELEFTDKGVRKCSEREDVFSSWKAITTVKIKYGLCLIYEGPKMVIAFPETENFEDVCKYIQRYVARFDYGDGDW